MINIIVAVTLDNAIGKDGDQLYYIKEDLKRFKELTTGNTIVMGSNTFDALPKGALPNRLNIVLTRNGEKSFPGAITTTTPTEAVAAAQGEVYIIGGEQIYRLFMPLAQRIYLTEINVLRPDATKYFPAIDSEMWKEVSTGEWLADERTGVEYRFKILDRC